MNIGLICVVLFIAIMPAFWHALFPRRWLLVITILFEALILISAMEFGHAGSHFRYIGEVMQSVPLHDSYIQKAHWSDSMRILLILWGLLATVLLFLGERRRAKTASIPRQP